MTDNEEFTIFIERLKSRLLLRLGSSIISQFSKEGSQMPEIDAFQRAYAGKNKEWNNDLAKSKHEEMLAKRDEYLQSLAEEYPEGTPLEDIQVTDENAGLKIMTYVLGSKPGCQIRGLGKGRCREVGTSSRASLSTIYQLQKALEAEKEAQEAEKKAREADRKADRKEFHLLKLVIEGKFGFSIPSSLPPQSNQHMNENDEATTSMG